MSSFLQVSKLSRLCQIEELVRDAKAKSVSIDGEKAGFVDRQNELIVVAEKGRRFDARDIKMALEIVSVSRSAYSRLRNYLPLPSIRTLQNTFSAADKMDYTDLVNQLPPMQKYIRLNIDEVYVKSTLRFTGGKIYGFAKDDPTKLVKTILVILALADHNGPKFVASLNPVYKLNAAFQNLSLIHI